MLSSESRPCNARATPRPSEAHAQRSREPQAAMDSCSRPQGRPARDPAGSPCWRPPTLRLPSTSFMNVLSPLGRSSLASVSFGSLHQVLSLTMASPPQGCPSPGQSLGEQTHAIPACLQGGRRAHRAMHIHMARPAGPTVMWEKGSWLVQPDSTNYCGHIPPPTSLEAFSETFIWRTFCCRNPRLWGWPPLSRRRPCGVRIHAFFLGT